MALTDGERLLGIMLAEIMEHFEMDAEIDPAFVKRVLINKDDWALGWKYGFLGNDKPADDAIVDETASILTMFRVIEATISELAEPEKSELAAHSYAKFKGFDGNNDQHFGVAGTLINDLGRFEEFAGRGLNSHSQATLPRYRQMLPRFDKVMQGSFGDLSADDVREILG